MRDMQKTTAFIHIPYRTSHIKTILALGTLIPGCEAYDTIKRYQKSKCFYDIIYLH